ncbi:uncharacterized protein GLRG_01001 [Colletotrichum graminicola M1.001]|uniref:Uncharacterized protein n=1 Tax=Colletotrichum graminicola (strain M1.001 / M2 / FGSC 10212) TaxID=645133 RepID=E3Q590_COLGM|nr:uncharacterized protein GLRG_01001 [Colletotrichum graminicola M1.001]EFQ25857.1 hypothetical protein GLRG_01001 [Colletotrichum graminicola M1.001]
MRLQSVAQALGLPQVQRTKPEGLAVRHQKVRTHHLFRVQTLKGGARTTKYNALEHIKWSGIAKSATRLPPVPLYNPSVGD